MHYVIIGGVAAGMSAAMEITRTDKDARITVLERGDVYSYGQCGLPYVVSELIPSTDKLIARSISTFRNKYKIDARTYTEVMNIDVEKKVVYGFHVLTAENFEVKYDKLLIASGTDPIMPDWQGTEFSGIYVMKTIDDTKDIIAEMEEFDISNVTIVGGGYVGLEMAESFVALGKNVTLIQRGSQVANIFDEDMAQHIAEEAEDNGVNLRLGESVTGFQGNDDWRVSVVETDKGSYETDLVLVSVGVEANTTFLEKTKIQKNAQGAIFVNEHMETNVKDVYAAGDCATQYHIVKNLDDHIPLGTTSNKQGRIAGANMAGNPLKFRGIVGTSIIKFFNLTLGRTGVTEKEAKNLNIPYEVLTSKTKSHAGYYPGAGILYIKMLYHKETKEILGVQIIGEKGVDKRIDVIATALYNKMKVKQLLDLDLAYSPPYNGVWDPLQQMAKKAK